MKTIITIFLLVMMSVFAAQAIAVSDRIGEAETNTLIATDTYTSPWYLAIWYKEITVMIYSDQPSAADGVQIQQSDQEDCNTAGTVDVHYESPPDTYDTGAGEGAYEIRRAGKCVRVIYTNGPVGQTEFHLGIRGDK